jgi:hypothetical protein
MELWRSCGTSWIVLSQLQRAAIASLMCSTVGSRRPRLRSRSAALCSDRARPYNLEDIKPVPVRLKRRGFDPRRMAATPVPARRCQARPGRQQKVQGDVRPELASRDGVWEHDHAAIADHLDRVAHSGCGHSAEIQRRAHLPACRRGPHLAGMPARRKRCAHQARTGLDPIQRCAAGSVRGLCRARPSAELRRIADLPGNGQTGPWAPLQTVAERQDFLPGGLL